MPQRNRWQRLVERLLPWYDPAEEDRRAARSDAIHEFNIETRIHAEKTTAKVEAGGLGHSMRSGYRASGHRTTR